MTERYEIRVKGQLNRERSRWFDGLTIDYDAERGETVIAGEVIDQTALYSLLMRARDLALTLVLVRVLDAPEIKGWD